MTPNLLELVQEIVDRPSWSRGNSLVFLFESEGPGEREAKSLDEGLATAAVFHIEYSVTS